MIVCLAPLLPNQLWLYVLNSRKNHHGWKYCQTGWPSVRRLGQTHGNHSSIVPGRGQDPPRSNEDHGIGVWPCCIVRLTTRRTLAARLIISRVKVYKKRLKDHNCRKNIYSTQSDAQAYQNIFSSRQRPAHVTLSNGQVVATDLLASHIQRKMNRKRFPARISTPDRYYFLEAAYNYTRLYLVSQPPPSRHHLGRC